MKGLKMDEDHVCPGCGDTNIDNLIKLNGHFTFENSAYDL